MYIIRKDKTLVDHDNLFFTDVITRAKSSMLQLQNEKLARNY